MKEIPFLENNDADKKPEGRQPQGEDEGNPGAEEKDCGDKKEKAGQDPDEASMN